MDLAHVITVLGIPANIAVLLGGLWWLDRRLVAVESALRPRERRDPYDRNTRAMEARL